MVWSKSGMLRCTDCLRIIYLLCEICPFRMKISRSYENICALGPCVFTYTACNTPVSARLGTPTHTPCVSTCNYGVRSMYFCSMLRCREDPCTHIILCELEDEITVPRYLQGVMGRLDLPPENHILWGQ